MDQIYSTDNCPGICVIVQDLMQHIQLHNLLLPQPDFLQRRWISLFQPFSHNMCSKDYLGTAAFFRPELPRFETLVSECYNRSRNLGSDAGTGHRLEHLDQVINNHLIASNQSLRCPYFYNHPMGLGNSLLGFWCPYDLHCCFSA